MKKLLSLFLLLALSGMCPADVKVKGEAAYEPHKKIVLKASDVTSAKAAFLWDVEGTTSPDTVEAGDTIYIWAAPGTYRVVLTAVDFDAKKIERAKFSFKVTGKVDPPVPPGPGPNPPPDDGTIEAKPCHVVVIEETEDATAKRGKWLRDAGLQNYVKSKAWKVFIRDKDVKDQSGQTPKDIKPYIDRVAGKTLPILFVVNSAGKVRYEGKLPATPADLLTLFKKIGG